MECVAEIFWTKVEIVTGIFGAIFSAILGFAVFAVSKKTNQISAYKAKQEDRGFFESLLKRKEEIELKYFTFGLIDSSELLPFMFDLSSLVKDCERSSIDDLARYFRKLLDLLTEFYYLKNDINSKEFPLLKSEEATLSRLKSIEEEMRSCFRNDDVFKPYLTIDFNKL